MYNSILHPPWLFSRLLEAMLAIFWSRSQSDCCCFSRDLSREKGWTLCKIFFLITSSYNRRRIISILLHSSHCHLLSSFTMKLPGEFAVHYESRNHWAVITQLHGSVYPSIWKYCVFNVGMMLLDYFVLDGLMASHGIKITDKGHTISIFFVAFFCVSRANMALARFNEARSNLGGMSANTRALIDAIVSMNCFLRIWSFMAF